ncbi:hypothetical protein PI125_g10669 [Phytophthora idaei]|nr:hypothetical protein PI125_g10669 [Phytophthora idaei]KAG3148681.1 hypothetical protein PI126_g12355 [Phytophthora idaei]
MRFNIFVALLVATFLVCCSSFVSAGNVNDDRRLRAEDGKNGAVKAVATFIERMKEKSELTTAVKAIQTSNADEAAIKTEILGFAAAKEGAKMSDESMAKISKMLAENAKKNPKSWPRLRKFAKITLGATAGGLAIYGVYKLLFSKDTSNIYVHDYYDDWYDGNWFDVTSHFGVQYRPEVAKAKFWLTVPVRKPL